MKRSELAAILRIMDPDTLYDTLHDIKLFPPLIFMVRARKSTPRDGSLRIPAEVRPSRCSAEREHIGTLR